MPSVPSARSIYHYSPKHEAYKIPLLYDAPLRVDNIGHMYLGEVMARVPSNVEIAHFFEPRSFSIPQSPRNVIHERRESATTCVGATPGDAAVPMLTSPGEVEFPGKQRRIEGAPPQDPE